MVDGFVDFLEEEEAKEKAAEEEAEEAAEEAEEEEEAAEEAGFDFGSLDFSNLEGAQGSQPRAALKWVYSTVHKFWVCPDAMSPKGRAV